MELHTQHLKLRTLNADDAEKVHALHILPETDEFNTLGIPETFEVTRQLVLEWLALGSEQPCKKYVFCLEDLHGEFVGLMGLNMSRPAYRSAEIWYKIHPRHWRLGYATEAVGRILHFCFNDLKLHRVEAGCAVDNAASVRVLEKAGMTREGRCRKLLPVRGQWLDNFEYAILETDFFEQTS